LILVLLGLMPGLLISCPGIVRIRRAGKPARLWMPIGHPRVRDDGGLGEVRKSAFAQNFD
jgi:hypothetical protein